MMISKKEFKAQVSRLSVLFMRETPPSMLREYYENCKDKDFSNFEKAVSDIIRNEDRFPSVKLLLDYYERHTPSREAPVMGTKEDLEKQAKSPRAKFCMALINDLFNGKTDIEDPRFEQVLKWHHEDVKAGKTDLVFTEYDPERRLFRKVGREPVSEALWQHFREQFPLKKNVGFPK